MFADIDRYGVVARHGYANEATGHLNGTGEQQAHSLCATLRKYLGEYLFAKGNTLIISSPLPRAREYADIIAQQYGLTVIEKDALGYPRGEQHFRGLTFQPEFIASQVIDPFLSYPVLLLITHGENTPELPMFFVPKKQQRYRAAFHGLYNGEAHIVNRNTGKSRSCM